MKVVPKQEGGMSHLLSTVACAGANAPEVLFLPLISNLVHLSFIITCSFIYQTQFWDQFDQIIAKFRPSELLITPPQKAIYLLHVTGHSLR